MKEEKIECPDCEGEGEHYVDTSHQCTTLVSECCGGCGYNEPCETCEGTGKVYEEN